VLLQRRLGHPVPTGIISRLMTTCDTGQHRQETRSQSTSRTNYIWQNCPKLLSKGRHTLAHTPVISDYFPQRPVQSSIKIAAKVVVFHSASFTNIQWRTVS